MIQPLIGAKAARLLREKHEVKTPQERGTSDEEAEAMPVESEPTVAEINIPYNYTNNKR